MTRRQAAGSANSCVKCSPITFWPSPPRARRTKITSAYPPLTAVGTTYATPPFLPFLDPPIELASFRPRGHSDLDGWIDCPPIRFGKVPSVVIGEVHNAIRTWRRFCGAAGTPGARCERPCEGPANHRRPQDFAQIRLTSDRSRQELDFSAIPRANDLRARTGGRGSS